MPARESITVPIVAPTGRYDVQLFGADGFVRAFRGNTAYRAGVQATLRAAERALDFTLTNDTRSPVRFALTSGDGRERRVVNVRPGRQAEVSWPTERGRYDVVVTSGDGPMQLTHHFVGSIEHR